ncbi:hypothetical protein HID58_003293 [Brassica napus]|uniref:Brix domain-containing protein n=1 Tax=Brassica napus TaxID=3708 RepID=A0ABQ8EST5_BRANA|nr:hypothetical protein HID58_003293 [Brassica napus]
MSLLLATSMGKKDQNKEIDKEQKKQMGRKRKHSETEAAAPAKKDDSAAERPKRTLLGWKDKNEDAEESKAKAASGFRNKEKVLVTCSRRISFRYRHLMLNMVSLLPHCKKDSKVEAKSSKGATLNELVELKGSSSCLFFECRKHKDLYMWMVKSPSGPSVKFLVFGIPKEHRKSKPYHDHVFAFSIVDDHIWFRNYQISVPHNEADKVARGGLDKMTLVEVGPRFCLNPIKIFGGSFGGPTLYENPFYVSPNQIRALEKRNKAGKFAKKIKAKTRRKRHELSNPLEPDDSHSLSLLFLVLFSSLPLMDQNVYFFFMELTISTSKEFIICNIKMPLLLY